MHYLLIALFVLAAAFAFARVEIEIEGPHGWAESLPTWRIRNRWTKIFYGNRPLTGYHFWLQVFVFVLMHAAFALNLSPWSWPAELRVIGFIIVFFIVEDFLWFVFNPAYGIEGIPYIAILAPDGTVRHAGLNPHDPAADITGKVEAILKEFKLPVPKAG